MEKSITHSEGHLHVAAIRLLSHQLNRPPTMEEIAELLSSQVEITNHRLRALEERGIVAIVENPFEVHVSVENHLALEELPAEHEGEALADAVQDFQRRQQEESEEMMRIFEDQEEEKERKSRNEELEEGLKNFKKKKVKKAPWEK